MSNSILECILIIKYTIFVQFVKNFSNRILGNYQIDEDIVRNKTTKKKRLIKAEDLLRLNITTDVAVSPDGWGIAFVSNHSRNPDVDYLRYDLFEIPSVGG